MPTIKDVARRAGVGIGHGSRTLHNSSRLRPETAERVRQAIEELGYRPDTAAQSLASGPQPHAGASGLRYLQSVLPRAGQGFEEAAVGNGYDVFAASTNYDPARTALCVQRMIERKLDGVAIMTSEIDPGLTDSFAAPQGPTGLPGCRQGRTRREQYQDRLRPRDRPGGGAPPRTGASAASLSSPGRRTCALRGSGARRSSSG